MTTPRKRSVTAQAVHDMRSEGLSVFTRKQWGTTLEDLYQGRRREKPHSLLPNMPVDTVWQHITVTHPSGDFKADCRTVERIGMERFGTGCSYNLMVDMTYGLVGIGQPFDAKGAHTINEKPREQWKFSRDQNAVSLGIVVIGMPDTHLSSTAEHTLATILSTLIKSGIVTRGFDYVPHSLVAAKDCPCDSTRDRMGRIRIKAIRGLEGQG